MTLWANWIIYKSSIKNSPYVLVYGKQVILPPHMELLALQLLNQYDMNNTNPL